MSFYSVRRFKLVGEGGYLCLTLCERYYQNISKYLRLYIFNGKKKPDIWKMKNGHHRRSDMFKEIVFFIAKLLSNKYWTCNYKTYALILLKKNNHEMTNHIYIFVFL